MFCFRVDSLNNYLIVGKISHKKHFLVVGIFLLLLESHYLTHQTLRFSVVRALTLDLRPQTLRLTDPSHIWDHLARFPLHNSIAEYIAIWVLPNYRRWLIYEFVVMDDSAVKVIALLHYSFNTDASAVTIGTRCRLEFRHLFLWHDTVISIQFNLGLGFGSIMWIQLWEGFTKISMGWDW